MDLRIDGRAGCDHHDPSVSSGMAAAFAPTAKACNFDHFAFGGGVSNRGDACN